MARTLYLLDGSCEVLFSGDDPDEKAQDLERILRERLGTDAVTLFKEVIDRDKNGWLDLEQELDSYERSCDHYVGILEDVMESLQSVTKLLSAERINRKQITDTVSELITKINNEL